jgi:2-dehydro-3-deoxyphosphooctonate aldolase (KDO 8-P synthase)
MSSPFKVGNVTIGGGELFLIAGPCVIESEEHAVKIAECVSGVTRALKMPFIFKASYDKANRTSLRSFRGPGLKEGVRILHNISLLLKAPVLTDVHDPHDVETVAEAVDVLQIPAFLCRQTDLLVAAAKSARAVNIKKGQFVSPWDMRHAVEKVRESGNEKVFVTERGSSFGYNNLVVDMRSLAIMREFAPVVFDATHSVQLPSAGDREEQAVSGGQPEFIPVLARAAVAAGVDGIFMEVHDNPPAAKSDGANALPLQDLRALLDQLHTIHKTCAEDHNGGSADPQNNGEGAKLDRLVRRAINQKRLIKFSLYGHTRIAEPHDYGIKKGVAQVLVYQVGGGSSSGRIPNWRRVDLSKISKLELLDETFPGQRPVPGEHSKWDHLILRVSPPSS